MTVLTVHELGFVLSYRGEHRKWGRPQSTGTGT